MKLTQGCHGIVPRVWPTIGFARISREIYDDSLIRMLLCSFKVEPYFLTLKCAVNQKKVDKDWTIRLKRVVNSPTFYKQFLRRYSFNKKLITKPNCSQFHQRFMRKFYVRKSFWQLFLLTCKLEKSSWKDICMKNLHVKCWWNWRLLEEKAARKTWNSNLSWWSVLSFHLSLSSLVMFETFAKRSSISFLIIK